MDFGKLIRKISVFRKAELVAKLLIAIGIALYWYIDAGFNYRGASKTENGVGLGLAFVALFLGIAVAAITTRAKNARRDHAAQNLPDSLGSGGVKNVALVLRPFIVDGRISNVRGIVGGMLATATLGMTRLSGFEGVLLRGTPNNWTVLKIGVRQQNAHSLFEAILRGRPRIGTFYVDDWWPAFEKLARIANVCIVVPPTSTIQQQALKFDT